MFGDNLSGIPNFEVKKNVTNHNDESIESLLLGNKLDIEELDSKKSIQKHVINVFFWYNVNDRSESNGLL